MSAVTAKRSVAALVYPPEPGREARLVVTIGAQWAHPEMPKRLPLPLDACIAITLSQPHRPADGAPGRE